MKGRKNHSFISKVLGICDRTSYGLGGKFAFYLNFKVALGRTLIYFAGHGFVLPNLARKNVGYLAATDTGKEGQNALSFSDFTDLVANSELKSLVVLLDCCHAGDLLSQVGELPNSSQYQAMEQAFSHKKNYYLMAACQDFERLREGTEHEIFTAAVLDILRAKIKAGEAVDVDSLFSRVSQRLKQSGQEMVRSAI